MIIDYILAHKSDLLLDILIILVTVAATYWYTEERNYIFHLKALIKEIKGNISQLSEIEFNKTLNEVLTRQRTWFAKGISLRVASGIDEGFLYQYLLDHAYTIFVTKGYVLKLQKWEYVKGGTFDHLAEFYLNCIHFNQASFQYEQNLVNKIGRNEPIGNSDPDIIALRRLREMYFRRLNENMDSGSINYLQRLVWCIQFIPFVIVIFIIFLLINIS